MKLNVFINPLGDLYETVFYQSADYLERD